MPDTAKKIWLLGHPIAHSLSPAMHNAALAHLKLDWRYEARDVPPEKLSAVFGQAREEGVLGMNVTVPHKLAALALADQVDSSARWFGAVNTIVARGTRFIGCNTDGYGLVHALREKFGLELKGKSVIILGAGGAGRAAAMQCAMEKARRIFLVNRTGAKAESLAGEIRAHFPAAQVEVSLPPNWKADLIINATSLGLHPHDPKPIVCGQINGVPFAYDMIYRPAETKFLRCARDSGAKTANGLSMLLHQGVQSLQLWLDAHAAGKNLHAPVDVMRAALKNAI